MKRFAVILLGVSLSYVAACDDSDVEPDNNYYDYSYIDAVLADDTIQNGESVRVVYVYPMGCNRLERIETEERGDTLALAALLYFYETPGTPCAHGGGSDTTSCALSFSAGGARYLSYRRNETTPVVRPVYVKD